MAPLDPEVVSRSNAVPLATFGGQILLVAGLATNILLTIRRAARTLPPAASTRDQEPLRRRHAAVFCSLGFLSITAVSTFAIAWRALSYFYWAKRGNHETPGSLWTGWYGTGDDGVGRWRLGDWTRDVDLPREADWLAIASPEGFLHTSQEFVGLVTAAIFMGVEGHKRNLSAPTIASFVTLSTVGSLGLALNLFFVTMLYTPVALHNDDEHATRDALFTPKVPVYVVPIILSFLSLYALPDLIAQGSDITFMRVGYFVVPLFLAFAPQIIPTSWGHEYPTKAAAHRSFQWPFYMLGLSSLVLNSALFIRSFDGNTPSETSSVYEVLMKALGKEEKNRFMTGLGVTAQKLKFVSRHPAISVTASDVLFTTISICAWAFVRNLDVEDILNNSVLSVLASPKANKHVAFEDKVVDVDDAEPLLPESPPKRGRGRPKKNGISSNSISTASSSASASAAASLRRSTRRGKAKSDYESDMEDTFEASARANKEVEQTESDGSLTMEDVVHGGESAALALFLALTGGLGQLGAGVFGAEVTSPSSDDV